MSDNDTMSVKELLSRMQEGWDDFQTYLGTLTEKQMTEPTDDAGWTAKDHVMHLAVWEDGVTAALEGQSRNERMGLDMETWQSDGFDLKNAVIQQQHKDKSLKDVLSKFAEIHTRMVRLVSDLSDADLRRPYHSYVPGAASTRQIIDYIAGDTYEHFEEHKPWIAAIVEKAV